MSLLAARFPRAAAAGGAGDGGAAAAPPPRALPWVEKYRPKSMEDISSQEEIVRSLVSSIRSGQIPHLLFYGPPGTGKTSTILAVARELYGPELMKTRVLELNASDERGIAVVREKVKTFAMSSVGTSTTAAPFKLIVLDEADSLTPDAQAALRRTMENYSKVTRFCIICNYVSRIIEPVASRCSKFRFKALDRDSMLARLRHVCGAEEVAASDATLDEVLKVAAGDMRKAITFLQSAATLHGKVVTPAAVVEISGVFPDREVDGVMDAITVGGFEACRRQAAAILASGYGLGTVFDKLVGAVVRSPALKPAAKAAICEKLAAAEKRLLDGADEELQLTDVLMAANRAATGAAIDADALRTVIV